MADAKDGKLRTVLLNLFKSGSDWEEIGIPETRALIVKRPASKSYSTNLALKVPFKGYKGLFFNNLEDFMLFVDELNKGLENITTAMVEVDDINPKTARRTTNKAKTMLPM